MSKTYKAVNWNTPENDYVLMFWEQNIRQFWIDTEYIPSKDIDSWKRISPEMKDAYKKALGGLTLWIPFKAILVCLKSSIISIHYRIKLYCRICV